MDRELLLSILFLRRKNNMPSVIIDDEVKEFFSEIDENLFFLNREDQYARYVIVNGIRIESVYDIIAIDDGYLMFLCNDTIDQNSRLLRRLKLAILSTLKVSLYTFDDGEIAVKVDSIRDLDQQYTM